MRQSRTSLASASVDRRTGLPKPICHSFAGCADRHASISRKLSRYVSWANAIARYCSVHGNVCTEWSPRYRATIRVNVLQGRQSISCENSVFPAFMGRPSPEKGRGNRRQLQIDTTENRRKAVIGQRLRSSSFALLRTAVEWHAYLSNGASWGAIVAGCACLPRLHRRLVRRLANRTNPNIALRCSRRMTREFATSVRSFIPLGGPDTIRSDCKPAGGPGQQAGRQSPEAPETSQPLGCGPRENASAAPTTQLPIRQEAHQEAT